MNKVVDYQIKNQKECAKGSGKFKHSFSSLKEVVADFFQKTIIPFQALKFLKPVFVWLSFEFVQCIPASVAKMIFDLNPHALSFFSRVLVLNSKRQF